MDAMVVNTDPPKAAPKPKANSHQRNLGLEATDFIEQLKSKYEHKEAKTDEEDVSLKIMLTLGYPWDIPRELLTVEVSSDASPGVLANCPHIKPLTEGVLEKTRYEVDLELGHPKEFQITQEVIHSLIGFKDQAGGLEKTETDNLDEQHEVVMYVPSTVRGIFIASQEREVQEKAYADFDESPAEDNADATFSKESGLDEAKVIRDIETGPKLLYDRHPFEKSQPLTLRVKEEKSMHYEVVDAEPNYDNLFQKTPQQNIEKTFKREEPVKPEEIFDQITEKIQLTARGQEQEVNIRLKPDYLGDVVIRVSTEKGKLKAEFYVENPEVRQTLQSFAQDLKGQVREKGFEFAEISVHHMSESWHSDSQNHNFTGQNQQEYPKRYRFRVAHDLRDETIVQSGYDRWDKDSSVNYVI